MATCEYLGPNQTIRKEKDIMKSKERSGENEDQFSSLESI